MSMRLLARLAGLAGIAGVLAACVGTAPALGPGAQRPAASPPGTAATTPSANSAALKRYYTRVQNDLLTRGLLRVDGGGPDTRFSSEDLAWNFERIVFYDEYARGAGLTRSTGQQTGLRRWSAPVRVNLEFGASVPEDQRARDSAVVANYVQRLARATRHPISMARSSGNFHVMIFGEDDGPQLSARLRQLVPSATPAALNLLRNVPRSIHCLVLAFSSDTNDNDYRTAVALVRAEHPDLLRRSCVHEEMAQGLGLANDSPRARPSIFNDDDEFALLTTHDEMLLRMLYDRRLQIGMRAETARPIVRQLAIEQTSAIN